MAGDEEKAEEEKDTELDLIAEQELLRLMRQFRVQHFEKYDWLVILYLRFFKYFSYFMMWSACFTLLVL